MQTGPGSPLRGVLVRAGVVGALVAAAAGLRAGSPLGADSGRWHAGDLLHTIGSGLQITVLVWVVVVLVLLLVNRPDGPPVKPARRNQLATLLVLLGAVLAAVLVRSLLTGGHPDEVPPTDSPSPPPAGGGGPASATDHRGVYLLAALGLVAVLSTALLARRKPVEAVDVTEPDPVTDGLAAAFRSLRDSTGHEPRYRVVLAYAAFEQALLERGVAKGIGGTPEVLLRRAVEAGAAAEPAAALTRLFGQARFGIDPVTEDDVASAERALATLLAVR